MKNTRLLNRLADEHQAGQESSVDDLVQCLRGEEESIRYALMRLKCPDELDRPLTREDLSLLEEAIRIYPELKDESVNDLLNYWRERAENVIPLNPTQD